MRLALCMRMFPIWTGSFATVDARGRGPGPCRHCAAWPRCAGGKRFAATAAGRSRGFGHWCTGTSWWTRFERIANRWNIDTGATFARRDRLTLLHVNARRIRPWMFCFGRRRRRCSSLAMRRRSMSHCSASMLRRGDPRCRRMNSLCMAATCIAASSCSNRTSRRCASATMCPISGSADVLSAPVLT